MTVHYTVYCCPLSQQVSGLSRDMQCFGSSKLHRVCKYYNLLHWNGTLYYPTTGSIADFGAKATANGIDTQILQSNESIVCQFALISLHVDAVETQQLLTYHHAKIFCNFSWVQIWQHWRQGHQEFPLAGSAYLHLTKWSLGKMSGWKLSHRRTCLSNGTPHQS